MEKLRRNSLVLQFQKFRIKIDAKVDDWWRVFKREHIFKNNFDKINFQKFLAPGNDAKTNRRWGRSSLPLTQHSRIASPHLLPPIVPWMLALWQQLLTRGWQTRMMWRCFFIRPPSLPQAPVQRRSPVPGRVCILLLTASAFQCPAPKHGFEVGTAWRTNETKALGDAPQVPVSSHPRSW